MHNKKKPPWNKMTHNSINKNSIETLNKSTEDCFDGLLNLLFFMQVLNRTIYINNVNPWVFHYDSLYIMSSEAVWGYKNKGIWNKESWKKR